MNYLTVFINLKNSVLQAVKVMRGMTKINRDHHLLVTISLVFHFLTNWSGLSDGDLALTLDS